MVIFKTKFTACLFMSLNCLGVMTSDSASIPEITTNQTGPKSKPLTNKQKWVKKFSEENDNTIFKHNNTDTNRPLENELFCSLPLKMYHDVTLAGTVETASNTFNVFNEEPLDLSSKPSQNKNAVFRSETDKYRRVNEYKLDEKNFSVHVEKDINGSSPYKSVNVQQYFDIEGSTVCQNLNDGFEYTPHEGSNIISSFAIKRDIGHTTTPSGYISQGLYCQNPSTSSYQENHPTKRLKHDSELSASMYTKMNPIMNDTFSFEHNGDTTMANMGAYQANTQCNLPCCISNFENITNHGFQYYDNKTVFLTNNYTHSRDSIPTEFRDMSQCQKEKHKIEIQCLDISANKIKEITDKTYPALDVCGRNIVISEPSFILDSPYSLAKRTPSHFCDYLFSVNKYIVHRKSSAPGEKFIGGIILEFDPVTNKIKRETRDIENPQKIVVLSLKIEFKVPIFVPLNFIASPNLEHFRLTMKRSALGIICFGEVLVSFVGGVVPDIADTFIKRVKMPCIFMLEFILSAEFPIYSFKISEKGRLWFNKAYPLTEGEYIGSMTIQKYFESLQTPNSDFNTRIHSYRYKEAKDLSPDAVGTFIPLYAAIDIIFKTSMSFSEAFKKIQSILAKDPKIRILDNQLDIKNEIKNMLEHLKSKWCITYHEDSTLVLELNTLISFYSFFYSEVKYVLEYWLNFCDFPLVGSE